MNFRIDVLNAQYLPLALPDSCINAFVSVYQVALKKTKVGVTNAFPNNPNPVWNTSIPIHGIRGFSFCFEVSHLRASGDWVMVGTAYLNQENLIINQQLVLPITPIIGQSLPAQGVQPTLTVCVVPVPAQPVPSPYQKMPIPFRNIVYLNLAFADAFEPHLPIKSEIGAQMCPLDVTLILFNAQGQVQTIAFSAEEHNTIGIRHSGKFLTKGYDTYGPTIRFSVDKLFGGQYPGQRALILVNCTHANQTLSRFKWIAVDVYTSNEKMNPSDLTPYFHSRISLPNGCPGVMSALFTITPSPQGLFIQPIQWFAPNQFVQFQPLFACEVTPELARLCGYTGVGTVRRTACLPYRPASLSRALSICGYPPFSPFTAGLAWNTDADLDAACLVYRADFSLRSICFYNNRYEFNGALQHYGDQKSGKNIRYGDDETIGFQLASMPPDAHYLAFTVTSYKGINLADVRRITLTLYVNGTTEIYRLNTQHMPYNVYGLLFLVIYRSSPTDWSMYPMVSYSNMGVSPVKIDPFVQSELRRTFH